MRPSRHASSPFELYSWQSDALSAWHDQDRKGVIEAITGAGKTMIGLVAAWKELESGGTVQVLVPSIVLLNQWAELLSIHIPDKQIGRLGGGERDRLTDVDVLVSVINSAREVEADSGGRHALIIADECHRYATLRNSRALDEDVFESRLGLSATYARTDDGHLDLLDPFFGGTCYEFGYSDALRNEVTAHFKVSLVAVDFDDEERSVYSESDEQARRHRSWLINNAGVRPEPFGLFMQDVSALAEGGHEEGTVRSRGYLHAFNTRRRILAETKSKLELLDDLVPAIESADKTLVFTETQVSSEEAAEKLESWGIRAAAIHAQVPLEVRKQLLSDFARGSISVLCAPRVLDEGVDVPAADLGVILAASHSQRQMIQRMGRLLRRKSDGRLARFVISFVRDTSEDPNTGAHETFLEKITEVADQVAFFDSADQTDELCAFLNNYQWLGPIPQPLMAAA
jgi:superfamily II DNA or RNA helicase